MELRALVLGVSCVATACTGAAIRPTPTSLTLTPYVGRLVTADATIQGRTLRLLFDTGAGLTMITPSAAEQIGCRPVGTSTGWRMDGERVTVPVCRNVSLRLGTRTLPLAQVGIFDLARVLPRDLPHIDGVLGLDAFDAARVTIDLHGHRIDVDTESTCRSGAWLVLPSRLATGVDGGMRSFFIGADVPDGARRWLELDSANLDGVRLSPSTAEAFGVASRDHGRIDLRLGPISIRDVAVSTRELVIDGALDVTFFEQHSIRIEPGAGGVAVCPSGQAIPAR